MNKSLIKKAITAFFIVSSFSCSNLFEEIINEDGSVKTGDTSLTTADSSSGAASATGAASAASRQNAGESLTQNTSANEEIVVNENPQDFYQVEEIAESTNPILDAGIVVIKASRPAYNQIVFDSSKHEYVVGDGENSPYLCGLDDPVLINTFKSDSNASVSYKAVQSHTTNIAEGSLNSSLIGEDSEYFVELASGQERNVPFTHDSSSPGNLLTFETLPYGRTLVTVTITADDSNYTDSYTISLNKKHTLTSLTNPESSEETLTKGLVFLKESDGFNTNQVSYQEETFDYSVDTLTSDDELVYLKAIPSDSKAKVEWKVTYVASPVYKYDYYQTVSTTVVKVDSNGILISGPVTESVTNKVSSYQEKSTEISESSDSSGNITTVTVTSITRKTITGLDYMSDVEEEDITSRLNSVENQETDRVRTITFPYGKSIVTASVKSLDGDNSIIQDYKITVCRVQYSQSESSENGEMLAGTSILDTTSTLEDLSITNAEVIDDLGNARELTEESSGSFNYKKEKTIYSITVDERTDILNINPELSENETITFPVSKTKYAEVNFSSNSVTLQGGLQVISFTVTEEGCQARTYTLYVYKVSGNTKLASINYISYDSISKTSKNQTIDSADYAGGCGIFTPATIYSSNGGNDASSANVYSLNVRADNVCDVSKMTFTVTPYDSHTHIYYYAGSSCPQADSDDWSEGFLPSDQNNSYTFDLENEGITGKTSLWLKTESRPYIHSSDLTSAGSGAASRSDVTYHKIEISKPGKENPYLKELIIKTVSETNVERELYSEGDTADNAGITHTLPLSLSKNIGTEIDQAKIYFRLADKSDESDSKTISYTTENIRSSSTDRSASNDFTKSDCTEEVLNGKTYYVITLGEIDFEGDDANASQETSKDLPMGICNIRLKVNESESTLISLVKPDVDTHTLQAKPSIGGGSSGVCATSFYDTVYYLNDGVNEVDLTMTTSQKNEKIVR